MNTYISTVGMSRADWLKARQSGIGGSDSPALILPREVYSWSRPKDIYKSKVSEPNETSPLACRVGSFLEPFVADLFTEATGLRVHRLIKSSSPVKIRSCLPTSTGNSTASTTVSR